MQLKLLVNQKTLVTWNLPLLALLLGALLNPLTSCKTPDDHQGFAPTIYAGDSESGSVIRDQAKESISCNDKKFDEMFCVFDRDLDQLFARCLAEKERDAAWYTFGKRKAGNIDVKKPDDASDVEPTVIPSESNEIQK